jgi:hypothetical protein
MKTIGFFEELQSNGSVARSWMRLLSAGLFILATAYMFVQLAREQILTTYLYKLVQDNVIQKETYLILKMDLPHVDWLTFSTLITLAVGGKLAQKFGESKTEIPSV